MFIFYVTLFIFYVTLFIFYVTLFIFYVILFIFYVILSEAKDLISRTKRFFGRKLPQNDREGKSLCIPLSKSLYPPFRKGDKQCRFVLDEMGENFNICRRG
jgi:hypothetical protein